MIVVNGEPVDALGRSVAEVLELLGLETRGVAIARNGDVVPRSQWGEVRLTEGDRIEIVTAAAGG